MRERKREKETERDRGRMRERKREIEREIERDRERSGPFIYTLCTNYLHGRIHGTRLAPHRFNSIPPLYLSGL